jgi:hypothetical protein
MQIKSYTVSRNVYFLLEKGIVFVEDRAGEAGKAGEGGVRQKRCVLRSERREHQRDSRSEKNENGESKLVDSPFFYSVLYEFPQGSLRSAGH